MGGVDAAGNVSHFEILSLSLKIWAQALKKCQEKEQKTYTAPPGVCICVERCTNTLQHRLCRDALSDLWDSVFMQ